ASVHVREDLAHLHRHALEPVELAEQRLTELLLGTLAAAEQPAGGGESGTERDPAGGGGPRPAALGDVVDLVAAHELPRRSRDVDYLLLLPRGHPVCYGAFHGRLSTFR